VDNATPSPEAAARAKQAVRERVWALLERERVARVGKGGGFSDLESALLVEPA